MSPVRRAPVAGEMPASEAEVLRAPVSGTHPLESLYALCQEHSDVTATAANAPWLSIRATGFGNAVTPTAGTAARTS